MPRITTSPIESPPRAKWLTLVAMCLALFMLMLDNTVVNVALPTIQRRFAAPTTALEWVVNGYTLTLAVLIVTMGRLGDLFGRKRIFLAGLALFTLSSVACGLASGLGVLIACRVAQGVGGAVVLPGTLAILSATFAGQERTTAIGIWAGVAGLGLAAGPIVSGALVQYVAWQAIFFVNVPIGVIALALGCRAIRESRDTAAPMRVDLSGVMTLTGMLFALTLALIEGQAWGWASGRILGLLVLAALLFVGFILVEVRHPQPIVAFALFRSVVFSVATLVGFVLYFAMFGTIFFITLYMQNVLGYSAIATGVRQLPLTALIMLAAPLAGKLTARFGGRPIICAGLCLIGFGLLRLSTHLTAHGTYGALLPTFLLAGIGVGCTMSPLASVGMGAVERAKAGMASGVLNMSRQLGGVFGVALIGAVFAHRAHSHVAQTLASLPLPTTLKEQIATTGLGNGGSPLANVDPSVSAQIHGLVVDGMVAGLSDAFRVAAIVCFGGAIFALLLTERQAAWWRPRPCHNDGPRRRSAILQPRRPGRHVLATLSMSAGDPRYCPLPKRDPLGCTGSVGMVSESEHATERRGNTDHIAHPTQRKEG